ncbi:aminopeptidase A-like [Condylostylus longicornis]|uniref:aminopeptidase A-like n=1 Tax=Condylostylus longicornis TaxID=2530218 RepID=UPI00244E03B0|nr:aminopeptidase A-like [Condylostylus longicornis]
MYPPNQPKALLVRPRSSLSTAPDEQRIRRGCCTTKSFTNLERTLCGFCIVLLILCGILLSAIILIGKSLANNSLNSDNISYNLYLDKNNTVISTNRNNQNDNDEHVIKLKPKIIFKVTQEDIQNIKSKTSATATSGGSSTQSSNSTTNASEMSETADKNSFDIDSFSEDSNLFKLKMSKIINKLKFRLPREIKPKRYDLYLHPNLKEKTFSGSVTIEVNISKPINFIPVHSKLLNITDTKIIRIDNDGIPTSPIFPINSFIYEPFEYWVMEFKEDLFVGEYWISLNFTGSLANRIVGFYQSSYFDPNQNETRLIATSKFEPTYARQAFPCFDEPDMKANFSVTLVRPTKDNYNALSNMDIKEEIPDGDLTRTVFNESVKMSTYLACFIVSDFVAKNISVDTKGIGKNFSLQVFATPAQLDKVEHALQTGKTITEYYIEYFQIPYPLPKLDMAAIPDFVSGAMEHWGLVTFRETALLFDSETSSTVNKQRIGSVVAHELAHMWFGNLVTMKWWNDLWLNEGFASYIQYKGLDRAEPSWKMLDQFLIDGFHDVLTLDATLASHPIVQIVENPDQITELFDKITYQKGSAVIRMLEEFVGEAQFQKAVNRYLEKFKYNNAETKDLLAEIASVGFEFDVENIMQTWTVQMGLPVVNVEKLSETEYKLKQKRFFANPEDENKEVEESPYNYRWEIPITYFTSENQSVERKWFKYEDAEVSLTLKKPAKWIKLNKNQVGYYRVNYNAEIWKELTDALLSKMDAFSVSDRAHLLNDAFALSDATQLDYGISLNLTTYLEKETEYVPWSVAANQLRKMRDILKFTPSNDKFVKYSRNLIKTIYEQVGWEQDENHLQNLLRIKILDFACYFGYEKCLKEAEKKFLSWLEGNKIKPDITNIVYKYGMKQAGNEENWEKVWEKYLSETDASEKSRLMTSLAAIEDTVILNKFIALAWDEKNVRRQDYFTCLQIISSNPIGESLVWDYVRENWENFVDRFGLNERYLGNMIPGITSRFATQVKLKEMKAFFEEYPEAGAGASARKQAIANVEINIKWLKENEQSVFAWLNKKDIK